MPMGVLTMRNGELQLAYDLSLEDVAKERRHSAAVTKRVGKDEKGFDEALKTLKAHEELLKAREVELAACQKDLEAAQLTVSTLKNVNAVLETKLKADGGKKTCAGSDS